MLNKPFVIRHYHEQEDQHMYECTMMVLVRVFEVEDKEIALPFFVVSMP